MESQRDKLPALPPRPTAFYDGQWMSADKAREHMDAQDARIAELVSCNEAADKWIADIYKIIDKPYTSGAPLPSLVADRIAELTCGVKPLQIALDKMTQERDLWKNRAIGFSKGMKFMEEKTGVDADRFVSDGMKAMTADLERIAELEREIREAQQLFTRYCQDTNEHIDDWMMRTLERSAERENHEPKGS